MIKVKEPKPKVKLLGENGNAFFILGRVKKILTKSNLYNEKEIKSIFDEMKSSNYDYLLQTAMKYCEVE